MSAGGPSAGVGGRARAGLLAAPVAWAVALLLLPLVVMVAMSLGTRPPEGFVRYDWSGEAWGRLAEQRETVTRTAERSVEVALLATLFSVALATPVAWWIARAPPRRRPLWLLLVVLPSWTSFLLRTYAWRFLFGNEGPVNGFLEAVGAGAARFLNTQGAVVVGLVYGYLPFAVLPIYVAVERMDRDLLAAARDLGATPARAYWRVAFPLTLPGTIAGAVLVFVPSLAAFVTPQILGGADTYLLGQMVQERYLGIGRDWPFGAAIGVCLAGAAFLALLPLRRGRARA